MGRVIDPNSEQMENFSVTLSWDFFDNDSNRQTLFKAVKNEIISRSNGELSQDLADASPYEIVEVNRVNAN